MAKYEKQEIAIISYWPLFVFGLEKWFLTWLDYNLMLLKSLSEFLLC